MSVRALCHTPARSAPPRPRASQGCEWMDAVSTLTHRSQSSPSGATTKGSPGSARRHARAEAPASARAEQTAPARARRRWSGSPPARAAAPTPPSHLTGLDGGRLSATNRVHRAHRLSLATSTALGPPHLIHPLHPLHPVHTRHCWGSERRPRTGAEEGAQATPCGRTRSHRCVRSPTHRVGGGRRWQATAATAADHH